MENQNSDPLPWPRKGDRLVSVDGDRRLNAYIGNGTDPIAHIEGYKQAADMLYEQLRDSHRPIGIDMLVYPILFLYRHYIELCLKDIIASGSRVTDGSSKHVGGHVLTALWGEARAVMRRLEGKGVNKEIAVVGALIEELEAFDPSSVGFRYSFTDKNPSFSEPKTINLETFHAGMQSMHSFFVGVRSQFAEYNSDLDHLM